MVTVRPAGPGDWEAIGQVHAEGWRAAYRGLLPDAVIGEMTSQDRQARRQAAAEQQGHRVLVAVAEDDVIGFASFGPERLPRADDPHPGPPGELYAIYVVPRHWSTGAGRALLQQVVAECGANPAAAPLRGDDLPELPAEPGRAPRGSRYGSLGLWVLEGNARARSFYARAGFEPTGERRADPRFGGVVEIRYALALASG